MTAEHAREEVVQRRLRSLTLVVLGFASCSLLLSLVPHTMDWTHRLWTVTVVLPAAWVLRSPQLRPVLTWAGWMILAGAGLEAVTGGQPPNVAPGWTPVVNTLLWLACAGIVLIAMPLIRLSDRKPPGLPPARIHDD